ncbi:MAG TPA: hypothetical protein VGN91_16135 [Bosea sp. (in: a-proteobacteria)]|nr:hypothetical protein [Bosea sp. (in: a-proteobacteria)]
MSTRPVEQYPEDILLDAEVLGLLDDPREEHGCHSVALMALTRSYVRLLADADRSASQGLARRLLGRGTAGARSGLMTGSLPNDRIKLRATFHGS